MSDLSPESTLVFWRLVRGPTAADRVIALRLTAPVAAHLIARASYHSGVAVRLDTMLAASSALNAPATRFMRSRTAMPIRQGRHGNSHHRQ